MDPKMFCFQCQETAHNTGCLIKGVCGKEASTARLQDLLLFVVRGISVAETLLRQRGEAIPAEVYHFNTDALFCTITNANFDDDSIAARVERGLSLRDELVARLPLTRSLGAMCVIISMQRLQKWVFWLRLMQTNALSPN